MNNYYIENREKLLKSHKSMTKAAEVVLNARYGAATTQNLLDEIDAEFEVILPKLPYLGGDANDSTENIVKLGTPLAMYRVLKRHGEDLPLIGDIVYETARVWIQQYPKLLRRVLSWYFMTGWFRRKKKQEAAQSQEMLWEGDFVYEVVEGDGDDFEWGVNYQQCAIVKFFAQVGATEFAPYMCRLDWAIFEGLGLKLKRTQTIARGGTHCDFRFQRL